MGEQTASHELHLPPIPEAPTSQCNSMVSTIEQDVGGSAQPEATAAVTPPEPTPPASGGSGLQLPPNVDELIRTMHSLQKEVFQLKERQQQFEASPPGQDSSSGRGGQSRTLPHALRKEAAALEGSTSPSMSHRPRPLTEQVTYQPRQNVLNIGQMNLQCSQNTVRQGQFSGGLPSPLQVASDVGSGHPISGQQDEQLPTHHMSGHERDSRTLPVGQPKMVTNHSTALSDQTTPKRGASSQHEAYQARADTDQRTVYQSAPPNGSQPDQSLWPHAYQLDVASDDPNSQPVQDRASTQGTFVTDHPSQSCPPSRPHTQYVSSEYSDYQEESSQLGPQCNRPRAKTDQQVVLPKLNGRVLSLCGQGGHVASTPQPHARQSAMSGHDDLPPAAPQSSAVKSQRSQASSQMQAVSMSELRQDARSQQFAPFDSQAAVSNQCVGQHAGITSRDPDTVQCPRPEPIPSPPEQQPMPRLRTYPDQLNSVPAASDVSGIQRSNQTVNQCLAQGITQLAQVVSQFAQVINPVAPQQPPANQVPLNRHTMSEQALGHDKVTAIQNKHQSAPALKQTYHPQQNPQFYAQQAPPLHKTHSFQGYRQGTVASPLEEHAHFQIGGPPSKPYTQPISSSPSPTRHAQAARSKTVHHNMQNTINNQYPGDVTFAPSPQDSLDEVSAGSIMFLGIYYNYACFIGF